MTIAESILSIIEISLHLIDQHEATKIQDEIASLRNDYAVEISKPYGDIDDALLYSLELRLNSIVQLYSTAAKSKNA